jgi:phosphoglycerate dehydrogenase-like enzyme
MSTPTPGPWRALFLTQDPATLARVFAAGRRQRVEALVPTRPGVVRREDLAAGGNDAVEFIFSTWGMPALDDADLARLPRLRAVFYAAGAVKGFAGPLLARGIAVSSAWRANAIPVAEAALAWVILALKQTLPTARAVRAARAWEGPWRPPVTGAYGAIVGVVALGATGRRLVELLRALEVQVIAYDPVAEAPPGVELVDLATLFARADVVSIHLPSLPATRGLITGELVRAMKAHATVINTARGAVVREDGLVAALRARPDLQAVLDVAEPEPPPPASPLYDLPNVLMTPHTAGSLGNEVLRLADWAIADCARLLRGEPLQHGVDARQLAAIA